MKSDGPEFRNGNPEFATTQWQIVREVADSDSGVRRSALANLCEKYWYPLYAYVRRLGSDHDEAADLTQAFFADLLQRGSLANVDPNLGRFRSFLLAAIRHFVHNQWKYEKAAKRGGTLNVFSLNFSNANDQYSQDPELDETPETFFEREWATTLIHRVYSLLEKEFENKGKKFHFEILKTHLSGKNEEQTLREAASRLGITEVAAKVSVHRMRDQFGVLLRQEIRNTIDGDTDVEEEIQYLFSVLRG